MAQRTPDGHRRGLIARAVLAVVLGLLLLPGAAALAVPASTSPSTPTAGDWFEFDYDIYLDQGVGNYSFYTEQTTEHYRYHVVSVVGDNVTMYGSGSWQFSNSSGSSSSGTWAETFAFNLTTRAYAVGFDVLGSYTKPVVWFWVPTPLSVGQTIPILSSNYTVKTLSSDVWGGFPPLPRTGVQLETTGSFLRTDSYGNFNANWDDTYWFDPASGYVVAETYVEQDSNSAGDGFRWRELATVTSSSYGLHYDWLALLGVYAGLPAAAAGTLVSIRWYHRGPRRAPAAAPSPSRITVRRVGRPAKYLALPSGSTSPYASFLPLILRRARKRKNPVWIATDGTRLVGGMVRDREAKVSTLFTEDPNVAKLFRSMNHSRNFFAEIPAGAWSAKAAVIDTFQLLALSPVVASAEGAARIRPIRPEDLPAVLRLAQDVYTIPEPKWLRQAYEDGDIGFAAWDDEDFVGFAFASIAGDDAILHTLTVKQSARGRGFGRSLMAARLNALAALGVRRALVEISVRNPGSLAIAHRFGFGKIGETTYFSRKPRRAVPIDRRPL